MQQLELDKANSGNLPTCWMCGQPMQLLDEEGQRYYCFKDNQVCFGKEQKWVDEIEKIKQEELFNALYVDGYQKLASALATISLSQQSIELSFKYLCNALKLEFPYSSIEVSKIMELLLQIMELL